ncbi:serine-protein kinase ATM [Bacillus rossius redtenbacheri]|uniref:serine-protein kinase ATM n=1 Tax=Bacillus rossius redtenbacheri TaxID=93214 RepID=UPI002FDF0854
MSTTEQALENFCNALESSKITERKKAIEELSQMLQNPEILELLNRNSKKNAGGKICWDTVFNAAHSVAIQEAKRICAEEAKKEFPTETLKSNWDSTKSACGSFILLVVGKANRGEPRLKCSDLISSVKTVLSSSYLIKCYMKYYVHILDLHLLEVRKYWADAKPSEWEELMEKFWELLDCTPPSMNKEMVPFILKRIIKCGTMQSHLALKLRTRFSNLATALKNPDIKNNNKLQCNLLELAITVCEQVSKESRMMVCEFGEEVLMSVIHLYEHGIERTAGKKSLMFAFLTLQVRLHHPCGAKEGDATAYAKDWPAWKKQCCSLYSMIEAEVRSLKRRIASLKDFILPLNFLQLAVVVCKQVYENDTNVLEITQLTVLNETVDVSVENASKKRRIEVGLQAVTDLIRTCHDAYVILPWLAILTELLSTFPSLVKYTDFLPMLTLVSDVQVVCDEPIVLQYLCRYCIAMLRVEAQLDSNLLDDMSPLWGKIVETALRIVGLSQCEESGHLLLQALVRHGKVASPTPLLQLYLSDTAKLSAHAVRTLGAVCRHWDVPESGPSGRAVLLDWLLPASGAAGADLVARHPLELAGTLVGLALKSGLPHPEENDKQSDEDKVSSSGFEHHYILCSFEKDVFRGKTEALRNVGDKPKCRFSSAIRDKLVDLLKRNSVQLEDRVLMPPSEAERLSTVLGMVSNVSLLASVLSCMVSCGIVSQQEVPDHSLSDTMCSQLLRVSSLVNPLLRKRDAAVYGIVSRLRLLVDLGLRERVSQFVRRSLPADLVEAVFLLLPYQRVLRAAHQETYYDERIQNTSVTVSGSDGSQEVTFNDAGNVRLQASMMLKSYICGSGSLVDDQKRYMSQILDLMASREFNYKEECDFTMAEEMLNSVVQLETIGRDVVQQVLKVLQAMCVARYQECHVASSLLTIVTGLVRHVSRCGSDASKKNTVIIMEGFRSVMKKKKYGILAYSKFLMCIAEFLKIDPLGTWSKWNGSNKTLGEDILVHMTSPFHEIRMECAHHVKLMFASTLDERALQRQNQLFDDVCSEVMESFVVDDNLSPSEMAEEGVNRTASALHTVASLIVASPAIHRKALYFFVELIHKKKINLVLAAKVLRLIGGYFKLKDATELLKLQLKYCLHHWLKGGFQLKDFPYKLIGYNLLLHFYNNHKNVLVPSVLKHEDDTALNEMAQRMGCTVSHLVMECFPETMAGLLPCLAVTSGGDHCGITETELGIAQRLHAHLKRTLGQEAMDDLIRSRFSEVMVAVMGVLHDPGHFAELCGFHAVLPEPCPPVFSARVVLKVPQHLQEGCPQPDVPLLLMISRVVPDQLHRILLSLVSAVHQAPTQEDRLLAFHRYATFVDAASLQLAQPLGLDGMTAFVTRDVCYTLMHLVAIGDGEVTSVARAACHFFLRFCRKCLPARGKDLSECLGAVAGHLVPLAGPQLSPLRTDALAALRCLVVDNEACMADAVARLDPFPEEPEFEALRAVYQRLKYKTAPFSLRDEIEHFLNAGRGDLTGRVEGLRHLKKQLSQRKKELCDLYEELQTLRGFSEDCAKSVVHRLVATLVDLTLSTDEQVSTEASCCLGELGPADLTTMILKPDRSRPAVAGQRDSLEELLGCAVEVLTRYLTDPNLTLVSASSDALYSILDTTEGRIAAEKQVNSSGTLKKVYLAPFLNGTATASCGAGINEDLTKSRVDQNFLWASGDVVSHDTWITRLVCTLLGAFPEQRVYPQLVSVCREKAWFGEHLLPLVINIFLCKGGDVCHDIISRNMRKFFQKHCEEHAVLQDTSISLQMRNRWAEQIVVNKASVQCMLNVVQYVRLQGASRDNTTQSLDLDYLHVAQAAQFCCAHFTSIMYAELWCAQQIKDDVMIGDEPNVTVLDYIYEKNPEKGAIIQSILREAYTRLSYGDAVFGCGSCQLLDPATRVHHLELEGKWEQAAQEYELLLARGAKGADRGLALALCRLGSYHLLNHVCASGDESEGLTDLRYECGWRLRRWDLGPCLEDMYEGHRYAALQAMSEGDAVSSAIARKCARRCAVGELGKVSLESVKNIYPVLSQLQALRELGDFEAVTVEGLDCVLQAWNQQDKQSPGEFEFVEPILSQRATVISLACDRAEGDAKNRLLDMFVDTQLKMAALAREEKWPQTASACLSWLACVPDRSWEQVARIRLEEAQVLWLRGSTEMAVCMLRSLLGRLRREPVGSAGHQLLLATALGIHGNWMLQTKSENPKVVIHQNFVSALDLIENLEMTSDTMAVRLETCASLARFADFQYQHLTRYLSSPEFEAKQKGITESVQMAQELAKAPGNKASKQAAAVLSKQSVIDRQEISSVLQEKEMYLLLAAKHYCLSLEYGDKYNLLVFRIASLWLQNSENAEVVSTLSKRLPHIPSYKFLLLLPQLAARLSDDINNPFVSSVHSVLERCAVDHPHHTLPVLLAISNLYLDQKYHDADGAKPTVSRNKEPRVLGAQLLVQRLGGVPNIAPILEQMRKLSEALVSLAYHMVPKTSGAKSFPVPETLKKIRNFDHVLVPSILLPVKKNGCYEDITGIKCFEKTFTTVGGINVPKKIFCIGTDGVKRPLLIKGKDDLRQDAVMQQVFTIMNALLNSNKETKKRKLLIRTYKVVPLSQCSGLIEWCENTQPLYHHLAEPNNYHTRYYPSDWSPVQCRNKIIEVAKASSEEKFRVYKEVCKRLRPAFHHFFLEKFRTPATWFERRQAYVHSVATSSMVGYILGLGDRHVSNILIDSTTAEVIHIDFGVAFEQGKVLPTAETVPFRLTRDIVDGMGVSGIEGVFRRSCEKTMSVLRENQETIHTILEVLLYDPLYLWTITPAKASDIQGKRRSSTSHDNTVAAPSEVNMQAERALLRLRQKLNGTEDGMVTSVPGQVNRLLQQARDPARLSCLFHGWQAYL